MENAKTVDAARFDAAAQCRPCGPVVPSTIPTLAACLAAVVNGKEKAGTWKPGSTSGREWRQSLANHAEALGTMRVDAITTADVLAVLSPMMAHGAGKVERLRPRLKAAFDYAIAQGYRADNPAGAQLTAALPKPKRGKEHHSAVPHAKVADAIAKVRASGECEAMRALIVFAVLTAARSGEVAGMTWREVDFDGAVWTVPAERMKGGKVHRVALSRAAVDLLHSLRPDGADDDGFVFVAPRGRTFQASAISRAVRQVNLGGTLHGFRSSFRDWVAETGGDADAAESALAHSTARNQVEAAYLRTDLFERRRAIMEAWAEYIMA